MTMAWRTALNENALLWKDVFNIGSQSKLRCTYIAFFEIAIEWEDSNCVFVRPVFGV